MEEEAFEFGSWASEKFDDVVLRYESILKEFGTVVVSGEESGSSVELDGRWVGGGVALGMLNVNT